MNLIPYHIDDWFEELETFIDSITYYDFVRFSSELANLGVYRQEEISEALERAMAGIKALNQPVKKHFKKVYVEKNGCVVEDWLLSNMAWYFTVLNIHPHHHQIAKMQYQIIQKLLNHE